MYGVNNNGTKEQRVEYAVTRMGRGRSIYCQGIILIVR
jgi:hypothetical protein